MPPADSQPTVRRTWAEIGLIRAAPGERPAALNLRRGAVCSLAALALAAMHVREEMVAWRPSEVLAPRVGVFALCVALAAAVAPHGLSRRTRGQLVARLGIAGICAAPFAFAGLREIWIGWVGVGRLIRPTVRMRTYDVGAGLCLVAVAIGLVSTALTLTLLEAPVRRRVRATARVASVLVCALPAAGVIHVLMARQLDLFDVVASGGPAALVVLVMAASARAMAAEPAMRFDAEEHGVDRP